MTNVEMKITKIQGLEPNGIYWVTVGDKDHEATYEDVNKIQESLKKYHKGIKWIVAPHTLKLSNKNGKRIKNK